MDYPESPSSYPRLSEVETGYSSDAKTPMGNHSLLQTTQYMFVSLCLKMPLKIQQRISQLRESQFMLKRQRTVLTEHFIYVRTQNYKVLALALQSSRMNWYILFQDRLHSKTRVRLFNSKCTLIHQTLEKLRTQQTNMLKNNLDKKLSMQKPEMCNLYNI